MNGKKKEGHEQAWQVQLALTSDITPIPLSLALGVVLLYAFTVTPVAVI